MSATKVLTTLAKLAFALAVLAAGWMMALPGLTSTWPLWGAVQACVAALTRVFPLERPAFAVLVLLLGVASLLAAIPVSVTARSLRKSPLAVVEVREATDAAPIAHLVAEPEESAEAPAPAEATMVSEPAAEPAAVLDAAPAMESTPRSLDEEEAAARNTLIVSMANSDRSRLADLLKKRGDVAESDGRLDEAMSAYEESIALRREVLVASPEDAREQRWLWTTLESLAECREDRGHRTRAAALFRESVSAGIRAVALAPLKTHYSQELQETHARLAALEAQLAV